MSGKRNHRTKDQEVKGLTQCRAQVGTPLVHCSLETVELRTAGERRGKPFLPIFQQNCGFLGVDDVVL